MLFSDLVRWRIFRIQRIPVGQPDHLAGFYPLDRSSENGIWGHSTGTFVYATNEPVFSRPTDLRGYWSAFYAQPPGVDRPAGRGTQCKSQVFQGLFGRYYHDLPGWQSVRSDFYGVVYSSGYRAPKLGVKIQLSGPERRADRGT